MLWMEAGPGWPAACGLVVGVGVDDLMTLALG